MKFLLKKSLFSQFAFSFAVGLFILFQNCAPVSFQADPNALNLSSGVDPSAVSCDPSSRPESTNSIQCPNGSNGPSVLITRNVVCAGTEWQVGSWSNPNYNSCNCPIQGQTVNPISALCECPAGQILSQNRCVVPTCNPSLQPSNVEIGSCPSGFGTSRRTRGVTCNSQNNTWQTSTWSNWDYSMCSCTALGQTPNPNTGVCECPAGQEVIGGRCQVRTCDPATKPPVSDTIACPSGLGTATRTRTVMCPTGGTQWSTGNWSVDFSTCSCAIPGQVLNPQNGTCACPAGQALVNGTCRVPTCDPAKKPTEQENISCPGGVGTAYRTRTVSCPPNATDWTTGAWSVINYSQCGCSISGQIVNPANGTCSCPAGQTVQNGMCKSQTCDPATMGPTSQNLTCPNNSIGTYTQTRTATCNSSTLLYSYSTWTPNYSTCSCPYPGQAFNTSTRTCECPSGQSIINGRCSVPTSPTCPQPSPSSTDYMQCPSGSGTAFRNNTVTCPTGSTSWNVSYGSWNYSSCGCSVVGAQVNTSNGTCSCPSGTYEVSGQCRTCGAGETYDAATKTCVANMCTVPDLGTKVSPGTIWSAFTKASASSQTECDNSKVTLTCLNTGSWNGAIPSPRYASCQVVQPTCIHPDAQVPVGIGAQYIVYTVNQASSQAACDSSIVASTCTTSGWSPAIPPARYTTCQVIQNKSSGQHCDIGGKWGWKADNPVCPAGTLPITATAVGGCADGAAPYIINGRMGCYHSNTDPRRRPECGGADPADECCFFMCAPGGETPVWTCNDVFMGGADSGKTYFYTYCTSQLGGTKIEYKNPPPLPPDYVAPVYNDSGGN